MRTTLDLDDDVLGAAKRLATQRGMTAGQVISDLVRQALTQGKPPRVRNGIPLLAVSRKGKRPDLEFVNRLRDGE